MTNSLSKRDQDVLEILISDYIASASPVGSKAISKKHKGNLSPATIRNIMAELERIGLLTQPHTSSGRVPTAKGLRYYVDSILKCEDLGSVALGSVTFDESEKDKLARLNRISDSDNMNDIIENVSRVISEISHYVGLITIPARDRIVFKQLEFMPLSSRRLLGIFVSREGFVQNKIIDVTEDYTLLDIERINRYCNSAFLGLTLEDAHAKIASELKAAEADYDNLLIKALFFSNELFLSVPNDEVVINGTSELFNLPEFKDTLAMRDLMDVLKEKKQILHILTRCGETDGVNIFIGSESLKDKTKENQIMESVSIVSAPYKRGKSVLGSIGVIGPVRMDYSRVVPIVNFTAKVMEDILN